MECHFETNLPTQTTCVAEALSPSLSTAPLIKSKFFFPASVISDWTLSSPLHHWLEPGINHFSSSRLFSPRLPHLSRSPSYLNSSQSTSPRLQVLVQESNLSLLIHFGLRQCRLSREIETACLSYIPPACNDLRKLSGGRTIGSNPHNHDTQVLEIEIELVDFKRREDDR